MNQKIWKRNFGPAWIHWKYYKHFLFLSLICNLFLLTLSLLSLSLGLSTSIPFCSQDSNSCVLLSRNKVRLLNATQIIHLQIKNEYQYIKIIVSIGVSTPLFLKGKSANCLSPPSPPLPPPLRAIPLYYWLFMIPLPPHTHTPPLKPGFFHTPKK